MRISTSLIQFQSLNAMLNHQSKLAHAQNQLSTGLRILKPSDDPSAAAKVLDLQEAIEQTRQFQDNSAVARARLSLEDTTLAGVNNLLQRVRELAVQGLNGASSPQDRKSIAAEVLQLKEEMLGLANTKQANGEYLFAGYRSRTQPFEETAITVTTATGTVSTFEYEYLGDANQRRIQVGATKTIADGDPGSSAFGVPFDHGIPPSRLPTIPINGSVFDVVNKLAEDLTANAPVSAILDDLDVAMNRILEVQTSVGARLSALDAQENLNEDVLLRFETARSENQDVDYAEAISRLNLETVALEAAQQTYVRVQSLSLFDFL